MTVRRGYLYQHGIDLLFPSAKQLGQLRQKKGDVICSALINQLTCLLAGKETAVSQVPIQLRDRDGVRMLQVQLHQCDVAVGQCVVSQCVEEPCGRGRHGMAPDKLIGTDRLNRLLSTFYTSHFYLPLKTPECSH